VVATVPEAVIGGLVAENLGRLLAGGLGGWVGEGTSIRPTTIERLGIWKYAY